MGMLDTTYRYELDKVCCMKPERWLGTILALYKHSVRHPV